ncbi:MAG: usg protein [Alphaproteobacteria bacterium]|nr:usg protein [Alphaproteobacteria bacterium]
MRYHSTPDLFLELQGYRLTTVEILYSLPDYPELLQTFIWQNLDLSPDFPRLHAFLSYWQKNIEGKLYSVNVAQAEAINIAIPRFAKEEFHLH